MLHAHASSISQFINNVSPAVLCSSVLIQGKRTDFLELRTMSQSLNPTLIKEDDDVYHYHFKGLIQPWQQSS